MNGDKRNLTKEEKWVDGQSLKDFGLVVKEKINKSVETRLDKGSYIGTADDLKAEIDGKLGVKNKAESSKEADVAGKLKTPVNINGVAFDGSSSITIEDSTKTPKTEFDAYKEEIATSKLDSGEVSPEYNSAKKIEDKIKALEAKTSGEFLEKGGYEGTAQDLKNYTDTKVASLVESAPETLDTLKELAGALGNDPNFATTVSNQIGSKLDKGGYSGTAQDLKSEIDTKLNSSTFESEKASIVESVNTKLDKGSYSGSAQDLKNEIDTKQPKGNYSVEGHTHDYLPLSGGQMTGSMIVQHNGGIKFPDSEGALHWLIHNNSGNEIGLGYDANKPIRVYSDMEIHNSQTFSIKKGSITKVNFPNEYGNPIYMLDKAGEWHYGIGANNKNDRQIRYGSCNITNGTWNEADNNFKHIFDGNLYANSGSNIVYHTGNFNGLVFKGKTSQETIDDTNVANGIYDIREIDLIGQGAGVYYTVFSDGNYETGGKSQLAFNYQFGYDKEMFFRTSNATEWEGGWKKVWHSGNFNPNTKIGINGAVMDANATLSHSSLVKVNFSSSYGKAIYMLDKPGARYFGIGSTGENQEIRYGACDISNGNWESVHNDYKHRFDGNIYANNSNLVWHEGNFDPNSKLNISGGTINGDLTVTGNFLSSGNVSAYSDIKFKSDIKPIENALDKVMQIGGYTYEMEGHTKRTTGVIAQEVQKVLPEVITEDKDGNLAVAYANMVGLLIEAIKEQQKQIEELKRGGK